MATFNHHGRILPEAETLLDRGIIRKCIRGVREDLSIHPAAAKAVALRKISTTEAQSGLFFARPGDGGRAKSTPECLIWFSRL
jgi:hypothetical protein